MMREYACAVCFRPASSYLSKAILCRSEECRKEWKRRLNANRPSRATRPQPIPSGGNARYGSIWAELNMLIQHEKQYGAPREL